MSHDRKEGKRPARRAFRPTVEGSLEPRALLSRMMPLTTNVAAGGQAVVVTNTTGQRFFISVVNGGTVRAFPAAGGRVNIVVDGSNVNSLLEINQVVASQGKRTAHTFNSNLQTQYGKINVASITVTSGFISAIEGYRDTVLSGPIIVGGTAAVDRIAVESVLPGGAIGVGGDLNTLDILNSANFQGGTGVSVGRDLNSLSVGGNLSFSGGANFFVGRDVGLVAQVAKGSGPAGQGINVTGNVTVASTGGFAISRYLDGAIVVNGNYAGVNRSIISGFPIPAYRAFLAPFGVNNIFIRGVQSNT